MFINMENTKKIYSFEFIKLILIYNGFGLIATCAFGYTHYFANKGKGIDDFLFALAILSLPSVFAAIATTRYANPEKVRKWLVAGLLFTVLCGAYVYLEVLYDDLFSVLMVLLIAGLPIGCFVLAMSSLRNFKIFRLSIYSIFILSFSSGVAPIFLLFILGAFGQILKLFL